jgi:hypothetical protein
MSAERTRLPLRAHASSGEPGVAADGDLLVGTNAQGPFVRTFGKLAGTQPEIVGLASPGLVPDAWSQPRLDGISDDGRLMFGESVNPEGRRQAWLLHPSERCSEGGAAEEFESSAP